MVIYKITNRLNGKIYVGQTRQPIEKSFLQHFYANSPLGNAMRDCGLENFTIEVIERCETQAQLNERERFWIRVLNCKLPNGYNQNDGGTGGCRKNVATEKKAFTMRIQAELLDKLRVIADGNKRSASMQIEFFLEECIAKYEAQNGTIHLNSDNGELKPYVVLNNHHNSGGVFTQNITGV